MKRFFFEIFENLYYIFSLRDEYFLIKRRSKLRIKKNKSLSKIVAGVIVILLIILGYQFPILGFSDFTSPNGDYFRGKTLWDWLNLAIVPIVIAVIAFWLSSDQKTKEIEIAQLHKREETLQKYFDQISSLLVGKKLSTKNKSSQLAILIKARTITTFDMLDGSQKGHLVRFLYELKLIDNESPIIALRRANLSQMILESGNYEGINLSGTNLDKSQIYFCNLSNSVISGCSIEFSNLESVTLYESDINYTSFYKSDLFESNLRNSQLLKANFEDANLEKTNFQNSRIRAGNFRGANLHKAFFKSAYLAFADFSFSNLRDIDLSDADLNHANFNGANLRNAILDKANLTNAILTKRQLRQAASFKNAKLPN